MTPKTSPLPYTMSNGAKVGAKVGADTIIKPKGAGHVYKMVALDLDGTLLRSNHRLSAVTINFLRKLDRNGFTVMLATGRPISTVLQHVAALGFPRPVPVVCNNGSKGVLCTLTKSFLGDGAPLVLTKELFDLPVPEKVARSTIRLAQELGLVTQYYHEQECLADPEHEHHLELTELYKKKSGVKTRYIERAEFEDVCMDMGPPLKLLVLCQKEVQDIMLNQFALELSKPEYAIFGDDMGATIIRGNLGWFLEILHPHVNKGKGVKRMCEFLKISIDDCIGFGDGDNDYEFLQMCGLGVAMKNGREIIKAIAREQTEYTNDNDGVMRFLQKMEWSGQLDFNQDLNRTYNTEWDESSDEEGEDEDGEAYISV